MTKSPHGWKNHPLADQAHLSDPLVLAGVLAASSDCIQVLDDQGHVLAMNDAGRVLMEGAQGDTDGPYAWIKLWPDTADAAAAIHAAQHGEKGRFTALRPARNGTTQFWAVEVSALPGAKDQPGRLLVIARDSTEHWQLQQALQAEAAERNHRIKNQMAVVQSIVNQTLRGAHPLDTAKKMIAARLDLLARAHDLLIHSPDERPSIYAIVDNAIQALDRRRVVITGPDLPIGPKAALSLSLLLHELASNAAKHGAFSVPDGTCEIGWTYGELEGEPSLELVFIETGGPPVVPPVSKGFGTRLLQGGVSGAASTTTLDFHPDGVRFRLVAILAGIQART